jgi:hypothetical protein
MKYNSHQVLNDCDWYVTHCFNELSDIGVIDHSGTPRFDLKNMVGPPNVQDLKKAKSEKGKGTNLEEDDDGPLQEYCPYGAGYKELHRNFIAWRSVPPGWKRRLLAEASDIALGSIYLTTKCLV